MLDLRTYEQIITIFYVLVAIRIQRWISIYKHQRTYKSQLWV